MYENKKRAGATTRHFNDAECLYLAIRIGNNVYGVIGIPVKKTPWIPLSTVFCFPLLTNVLLPWKIRKMQ